MRLLGVPAPAVNPPGDGGTPAPASPQPGEVGDSGPPELLGPPRLKLLRGVAGVMGGYA